MTQKLSFGKIILMWEGEWQVSYLIKFYREIKILMFELLHFLTQLSTDPNELSS